ncbi:MAG TPA: SDR family oxidoreductase [Polyangiaceae bacterium LLY-WYZ-14_1]|jgi:NAD(P)-dependent dehydrogenase (short-subunit alcohol dehydrogenase family)|nr:SDR family oxidoreductase [Polyangiaceae bacterium LLY-WYZ-14_1]
MGRLDDKVIIITGATGEIGRTTAKLLVDEGAKVHLVGRNEGRLKELTETLGANASYAIAEATDEAKTAAAIGEARSKHGKIDGLFANAGIEGVLKPLHTIAEDELGQVLDVNVKGTFFALKATTPHLVDNGGGSVVVSSSVLGLTGFKGLGPYVISKHALVGMMQTAALELAEAKVRVNTIHPSPVDGRMMRSIEEMAAPGAAEAAKAQLTQLIPMGRYATNEEVAQLVLFLVSDDSAFCTGSTFRIDGAFGSI